MRPPDAGALRQIRMTVADGLPLLAAFAISLCLVFNGIDDQRGNALLCLIGAGLCAAALLTHSPEPAFWRSTAPVTALVVLAIGWATAPDWLPIGDPDGTLQPDRMGDAVIGRLGLLAWLILGRLVARGGSGRMRLLDALLVLGVGNLLFGLLAIAPGHLDDLDIWRLREDGRFTGTFSNANVTGAYAASLAVFAFGRLIAFGRGRRFPRVAGGACALALLLALGACLLTGSRSALICGLVMLAAMALTAIGDRHAKGWLTPVLALVGVAALLALAGMGDLATQRFSGSMEGSLRPLMLRQYLPLVSAQPWHGYGLDSFPALNAAALGDPRNAQALWMVNSAHNSVVALLLQGGVPYLVLVLAAGALVIRGTLRAAPAGDGRTAAAGGALVLLGCSLVDIVLDVPGTAALCALLAGAAWGYPPRGSRSRSSARTSPQRSITGT